MQTLATKENVKYGLHLLKHFRFAIILIALFGIAISIANGFGVTLIIPLLQGVGGAGGGASLPFPFDRISFYFSDMGLKQRIQVIALLMVFLIGLKSILTYVNALLINRLQQNAIKYYRMLSFEQVMWLKTGYFNAQRLGHIQALIVTNTGYIGTVICDSAHIISQVLTIGLLVFMLFILSWQMTIFALILVGVSLYILRNITQRSVLAGKASNTAVQNMNSTLFNMLTGAKIIKLFSREKDMIRRFDGEAEQCKKNVINLCKAMALALPLSEFIGITSLAMLMIVGSFFFERYGNVSLQALLIFLFIFFRIMPPVSVFNGLRVSIAGHWPFLNHVYRFIEQKESLYIKDGTRRFPGLTYSIEMKDVDFAYDNDTSIVLRNVSFFIPKGLKIGIVGPSGSGKSTITELLLRFYDPQKGRILIDGIDLRELKTDSWRKRIGLVTQDTFLFNDTVRANIGFAKSGATQEEIKRAAKRAYAHNFIEKLPKGYDTELGERGVRLSGGQRQRLAIARAILTEPEILIFDEATSALDTESEQIVQKALDEVGRNKTVITIAHRLSTVSGADMIFVVEQGCILEYGTHRELLQRNGAYKKLAQLQTLENING